MAPTIARCQILGVASAACRSDELEKGVESGQSGRRILSPLGKNGVLRRRGVHTHLMTTPPIIEFPRPVAFGEMHRVKYQAHDISDDRQKERGCRFLSASTDLRAVRKVTDRRNRKPVRSRGCKTSGAWARPSRNTGTGRRRCASPARGDQRQTSAIGERKTSSISSCRVSRPADLVFPLVEPSLEG